MQTNRSFYNKCGAFLLFLLYLSVHFEKIKLLQYTKSGIDFPVITRSKRLDCYFLTSESCSSFVPVEKQIPVDSRY